MFSAPSFPLAISRDGTHFIQADGSPFFFLGDTAWPLLSVYTQEEAKAYIRGRAEQGFTVIQSVFSWGVQVTEDGDGVPFEVIRPATNEFGDAPWDGQPSNINEAYFDYVEELISYAREQGVALLVIGIWGNYVVEQGVFDAQSAYDFGHYLGTRFAHHPNLLWMNGGDRLPTGYEDVWNAYAKGVRDSGATQLMTYHPTGAYASSYFWHDTEWLDFNFIQSWGSWSRIYPLVLADRLRVPHKPTILGEGAYEDGPEYPTGPITPNIVRRQAYWSYFAGGSHTYGHNQSWRVQDGWQSTIDADGARQLGLLRALMEEREWYRLLPDQSILMGSGEGRDLRVALRSLDRRNWMIYAPSPGVVSVFIDRVASARVQATWVDPRSGRRIDAGIHETSNEKGLVFPPFEDIRSFNTPRYYEEPKNWEDSILLLDAIDPE